MVAIGQKVANSPIGSFPVLCYTVGDNRLQAVTLTDTSGNPVTFPTGGDATAANQVLEIAALDSIDTKTPPLGQALAAASVPVVLTAAQITTLTPPTSITISAALPSGTNTIGGVFIAPSSASTSAPTNSTSTAAEASRIAKASAGVVYTISGFNSSASTQYIQLHNSATLPADGVVPVSVVKAGPGTNFFFSWGEKGRYCSAGIVVCNSSTAITKTIGSADCIFDIQYS